MSLTLCKLNITFLFVQKKIWKFQNPRFSLGSAIREKGRGKVFFKNTFIHAFKYTFKDLFNTENKKSLKDQQTNAISFF